MCKFIKGVYFIVNEESKVNLSLKDLLNLIWKNLSLFIALAVLGGTIGFSLAKWAITPKYTSSFTMYVNGGKDSNDSRSLNLNEINAAQKMVNTYIVILQDNDVLQNVANQLSKEYSKEFLQQYLSYVNTAEGSQISVGSLKKLISLSAVNNTEVLQISAETPNAALSAKICSIISNIAPDVLTQVTKAGSVEVISKPSVATSPSSPKVSRYLLIGFAAGLFIAALIVFLREILDNKLRSSENLTTKYENIALLGVVPNIDSKKRKGGYYGYGKYGYYK